MRNFWKSLRNLGKIDDKWLFLRVLLILVTIKIALKISNFQNFQKIFKKYASTKKVYVIDKQQELIFYIKAIGNKLPFGLTCLTQALALKYFLSADNNTKLVLGVNKENQTFKAHAWVMQNHTILIGDLQNENFTPIWEWQ